MPVTRALSAVFIAIPSALLVVLSLDEMAPYVLLVALIGLLAAASFFSDGLRKSLGWVVALALVLLGVTYGLLIILAPVWETQVVSLAALVMLLLSVVLSFE